MRHSAGAGSDGVGERARSTVSFGFLEMWAVRVWVLGAWFVFTLCSQSESICPSVFVTGASSTGKTSVVRDVAESACESCAYVNCLESSGPRVLLEVMIMWEECLLECKYAY